MLLLVQLNNIHDSIEFISSRPKPLVIYAFTGDETFKKQILSKTSSGSVTFNDTLLQVRSHLFHLLASILLELWVHYVSCWTCSLYVILYPLEVLVKVASEDTTGSTLSILSVMKKQSCKDVSSLSLSPGIHHGITSSFNSSNCSTPSTILEYYCFSWDWRSSKWNKHSGLEEGSTSLMNLIMFASLYYIKTRLVILY